MTKYISQKRYEKGTLDDKAWIGRENQARAIIGLSLSDKVLNHGWSLIIAREGIELKAQRVSSVTPFRNIKRLDTLPLHRNKGRGEDAIVHQQGVTHELPAKAHRSCH